MLGYTKAFCTADRKESQISACLPDRTWSSLGSSSWILVTKRNCPCDVELRIQNSAKGRLRVLKKITWVLHTSGHQARLQVVGEFMLVRPDVPCLLSHLRKGKLANHFLKKWNPSLPTCPSHLSSLSKVKCWSTNFVLCKSFTHLGPS